MSASVVNPAAVMFTVEVNVVVPAVRTPPVGVTAWLMVPVVPLNDCCTVSGLAALPLSGSVTSVVRVLAVTVAAVPPWFRPVCHATPRRPPAMAFVTEFWVK